MFIKIMMHSGVEVEGSEGVLVVLVWIWMIWDQYNCFCMTTVYSGQLLIL